MKLSAYACAVLLLLGPLRGQAEEVPDPTQALYREALQSIAEGRKSDASEALARVIDMEPLHAGAWLELALIQCSLGHAAEAERLFRAIEQRFAPPPGILELINNTRAQGCSNWQPHSTSALTLGRGIDQNVNQGASTGSYLIGLPGSQIELPLSTDFLPKHDQYSALSGEYLRDLTPNGTLGFVQAQVRRNDNLRQYDSASLFTGLETPWQFGRWALRGTAMMGWISLGNQYYQRQTQLQARLGPPLPWPLGVQFHLMAGLSKVDYLTLDHFNTHSGELRGQFNYRNEHGSGSLSYGVVDERAHALRPGGDRHGDQLHLNWRQQLSAELSADFGFSRQHWRSASAYAPGLIDQVRAQRTDTLRAAFSYPLSKTQSLQLELRQTRNQENISIFQYNSRQLQLNWQWQN
ncbi:tetratricopeptide repeat protein [Pseudoduganella danionis]|uniref:tetratricopeptide repeat protein n=1 Tax=Pseudoduganella danionis TaxID=1890295 RepID=UPI0035B1D48E